MVATGSSRIVVTGIGVVSAIGIGVDPFMASLKGGRSGLSPLEGFHLAPFRGRYGGQLGSFHPADFHQDPQFMAYDRHVQMALVAAEEAVGSARLSCDPGGERIGLVMATCSGGMLTIEKHHRIVHAADGGEAKARESLDASFEFSKRYFSAALTLADRLGVRGPVTTVVTACAASSNAIGLAADWIRSGLVDAVVVGGADAFSQTTFSGFDRLKATSPQPCAPFSEPVGLNLGEGAGVWVLESEDNAVRRGARRWGHLLGYGLSNDAHHPTTPDQTGQGVLLCMERALEDAGVPLQSIGYINAHGTGTMANDKTESRTVSRLFEGKDIPPMSSTKSYLGHTLGAAGILEATASLLCLGQGYLPPTLNFDKPRDACLLDYIPNQSREATARRFLSNSFAFGGNNCSLILEVIKDQAQVDEAKDDGSDQLDTHSAPCAQRPDHSPEKDVVITGVGAVSPFGVGVQSLSAALDRGEQAVAPVERFDVSGCACTQAALVPDSLDLLRVDRRLPLRGMDRASQYATLAAKQAATGAKMSLRPKDCAQLGLVLGLTYSPNQGEQMYLKSIFTHGLDVPDLVHFPFLVLNSVVGNVSRALLLKGFSSTLCGGHGVGLDSLAYGVSALTLGHTDRILVGATDEHGYRIHHDLDALGLLADHSCNMGGKVGVDAVEVDDCPGGLVPGEGAVVFSLERRGQAESRGAPCLARVLCTRSAYLGGGGECLKETQPMERLLLSALEGAGVLPGAVGVVCVSTDIQGRCGRKHDDDQDQGQGQGHRALSGVLDSVLGRPDESKTTLHNAEQMWFMGDRTLGWAPAVSPLWGLAYLLGRGGGEESVPLDEVVLMVSLSRYGEMRAAVVAPPHFRGHQVQRRDDQEGEGSSTKSYLPWTEDPALDGVLGSFTCRAGLVSGTLQLSADLPYFKGHFPGAPLLPGVAQLHLVTAILEKAVQGPISPTHIPRIKFINRILPGTTVSYRIEIGRNNRAIFRLFEGKKDFASGEIHFAPKSVQGEEGEQGGRTA